MYTTIRINNRAVNPAEAGQPVYKVVFQRPSYFTGRGKNRREVKPTETVYFQASNLEQAIRTAKREAFARFCSEIRYGKEFDNTAVVSVTTLLDGRIIKEERPCASQ